MYSCCARDSFPQKQIEFQLYDSLPTNHTKQAKPVFTDHWEKLQHDPCWSKVFRTMEIVERNLLEYKDDLKHVTEAFCSALNYMFEEGVHINHVIISQSWKLNDVFQKLLDCYSTDFFQNTIIGWMIKFHLYQSIRIHYARRAESNPNSFLQGTCVHILKDRKKTNDENQNQNQKKKRSKTMHGVLKEAASNYARYFSWLPTCVDVSTHHSFPRELLIIIYSYSNSSQHLSDDLE